MQSGQRRALATIMPFSIEKLSLGRLAMSHSRTWRGGGEGKGKVGGADRGEGKAGTSGDKRYAFPVGGGTHLDRLPQDDSEGGGGTKRVGATH